MSIDQRELSRRLKVAREACHLTQDQVASQLGVSRSSVAQIELGNRAVSSLELDRLSHVFGRHITDFLGESFDDTDALVVLFRIDPEVADDPRMNPVLRQCVTLCRESTNLESLLDLGERTLFPALYPVPIPGGKWEAIQQGDRIARLERRRLNLGHAPLADVAKVLEPQGIRCAVLPMLDDVSGLFMASAAIGLCVVINQNHHPRRQAFSYAHEYAHLLLDRARCSNVSRQRNRDELVEVRANAFAASFLMPEGAVRDFVQSLGKGQESRASAAAFDESDVVLAQHRSPPHSQDVQLYDIVQLAHHFGVSFDAAVYRLRNLRLLTDPEKDKLLQRKQDASSLHALLDRSSTAGRRSSSKGHPAFQGLFTARFARLALEAYRRDLITRRKLAELAGLIDLSEAKLTEILQKAGLDDTVEMSLNDVRIPA